MRRLWAPPAELEGGGAGGRSDGPKSSSFNSTPKDAGQTNAMPPAGRGRRRRGPAVVAVPREGHLGRAPARRDTGRRPGRRGDVAEADRVVLGRHELPDAHVAVVCRGRRGRRPFVGEALPQAPALRVGGARRRGQPAARARPPPPGRWRSRSRSASIARPARSMSARA